MHKLCFAVSLIAGLCLMGHESWAKKAYVSDSFQISVRKSPSPGKKSTADISSGQPLEVLESKGEWSRIRTLDDRGKTIEGWVLSQYISPNQPWENQALTMYEANIKLKEKLQSAERQLGDASLQKNELTNRLQDTTKILQELQTEYTLLKGGSEGYSTLKVKYNKAKTTLQSNRKDIETLNSENEKLRASQRTRWLVIGALILLCGLMLGLIIGRQHRKRRSTLYY